MAYTANKRRAIQGGILPVADGSYDALDRAIINGLPALGALAIPTNPIASAGDSKVTNSVTAAPGASSHNLYWSASTPVTTGDTKIAGADIAGEVVTGLTNGLPYYFAWTAIIGGGESALSSEATATPFDAYVPSLILSDPQVVGTYRIDQLMLSQPTASLRLKEDRGTRNVKLPKRTFTRELYPLAAVSTISQPIPCLIGKGFDLPAFLIDNSTNRFKIVDHGLASFDGFRDENGAAFIPDTLFLASGEFIYTGWDGEVELFASVTATGANPVDAVNVLLTDTERGASIDSSNLDTTSTGKGFGSSGARVKYIRGHDFRTGVEVLDFPIGLYMDSPKNADDWIKDVSAASFSTVFVNADGLWQIKAWAPETSDDLPEIRTVVGKPKYTWKIDAPVTRVVALYAESVGFENFQAVEYADDLLRQLRSLPSHATKEVKLPLSDLFSAEYWAQRTVKLRGVPRRVLSFRTTQEFKELEIADYVRVVDADLDIDGPFEVLSVAITTGENPVVLTMIDVRGFDDTVGFWMSDAALVWDDSKTDAEIKNDRENGAWYTNEGGYADIDDPERSFREAVYI